MTLPKCPTFSLNAWTPRMWDGRWSPVMMYVQGPQWHKWDISTPTKTWIRLIRWCCILKEKEVEIKHHQNISIWLKIGAPKFCRRCLIWKETNGVWVPEIWDLIQIEIRFLANTFLLICFESHSKLGFQCYACYIRILNIYPCIIWDIYICMY